MTTTGKCTGTTRAPISCEIPRTRSDRSTPLITEPYSATSSRSNHNAHSSFLGRVLLSHATQRPFPPDLRRRVEPFTPFPGHTPQSHSRNALR